MYNETRRQESVTEELNAIKKLHQDENLAYCLTNDYMFRAVLQSSEKALRGLLAALLKINLEMQVGSIENWTDRSLYYLCRIHTDLGKGLDYTSTKSSIHIGIVTTSPLPEDAAFYNEYNLRNKKNGYEYTGKFEIRVLDLSQLSNVPEEEKSSLLYYWAQAFSAITWKEMFEMADKSEAIGSAVVTLHQLSEDKKIKLQCEARERYWMDWQSSMRTNFEKGQAAERVNTEKERQRADSEKKRADLATQRADSETERANAAEIEVLRLKEELAKLQRN